MTHASTVHLPNFDVEREWGRGEIGLPAVPLDNAPTVRGMDELALLMAGSGDHVVLAERPDDDYLAYLADLRIDLPQVLTAPGRDGLSEAALAAPDLLGRLTRIAAGGGVLMPHGVSTTEERLAAAAGIPLAAPPAAVCKQVNSKVYSRRLMDRLGLRQPPGSACGDLAEWDEAVEHARIALRAGRPIVVKDAFGVSGRGLLVVRDERRLDSIHRKVLFQAHRAGHDRVALVVEEWVPKDLDLNYQFTVERGGTVRLDSVKQALTERGVHKGHRTPAPLSIAQLDELRRVAALVGAELARDGYFGVAGVDALTEPDGGLYPVIEINARHNMSTYQARLHQRFVGPGRVSLTSYLPLRLTTRLPFATLRTALRGLEPSARGTGLVVNCFATVNAAAAPPAGDPSPFVGRLYLMLVAPDAEDLAALQAEVADRLAALESRRGDVPPIPLEVSLP